MVSPISLQLQPRRPTDRPQLSIACLPLNSIKMPRRSTGKCAELSILLLIVVEGGVSQRRQYSNYRGPSPNGPSGSISRVRPSRAAISLSPIKGKVLAVPVCGWYSYSYRVTIINQHLERFQNLRMQWNHCTFISQVYLSNNHEP